MENKVIIGNVCFILDRKLDNVLLLHRNKDPMKSMVTGVGGKTEFHEDIHLSCHREVYEETGIHPTNVQLKGVLKTMVDGGSSSWILFAYTAECADEKVQQCDEGALEWVPRTEVGSRNLIGFIRKVLPLILDEKSFFEGTIVHDLQGDVISERINVITF